MAIQRTSTVLRELLELVGAEADGMGDEDVREILRKGVPHALKAQLDIMIAGENEKTRAYAADRWLDRSGYSPIQKVAVKEQISFDPETLRALMAIAAEDDQDSRIRTAVGEGSQAGPGGDPAAIEAEVEGEPLLLLQGGAGEPGSDAHLSPAALQRDPRPTDSTQAAGVAARSPEDDHRNKGEADLEVDSEAGAADVLRCERDDAVGAEQRRAGLPEPSGDPT